MNITINPIAENGAVKLPEKLGFGHLFSRRMFTQKWTRDAGWHDAQIGHEGGTGKEGAQRIQIGVHGATFMC